MRVDVTPRRLDVTPGLPQDVSITISNTGTVIGGYAVRVLGADPSWVTLEAGDVSLFPDESRTLAATITVPQGLTAGERRVAIQVRELTPPEHSTVDEIVLFVPHSEAVEVRVDPAMVTAGRTARYSLLVENAGNSTLSGQLFGVDDEQKVEFRFDPELITLAPGEHAVVDLRATAKQPFAGSPAVRMLDLRLADPPAEDPDESDSRRLRLGRSDRLPPPPPEEEGTPLGIATFVQKPMVSRGSLSLFGLLAAITVFAIVITLAFSRIVGQSAADRNLALEIAAARDSSASGSGSTTSAASGTVTLLTSGSPVAAVTVGVYDAADTETPITTTATGDDGTWQADDLPAGDYKLRFQGAGFVEIWYPQALAPDDAETLTLEPESRSAGLDVALGGVPASISGTVLGDDVSAATLTLTTPIGGGPRGDPGSATAGGATVMSVPVGSDGTFELLDVPSPSVYELVVTKRGYATSAQRIDVGAGEERDNVRITLREGDGLISGRVTSVGGGALDGVTITATAGQTTVTTMSLSEGEKGTFALRGLPTPGSFTVVASKENFASQTLTLTLAEGQRLSGVAMTLGRSSGSLTGTVSLLGTTPSQGLAGVLVTVTDGEQTIQTASHSAGAEGQRIGDWKVGGLSIPGSYTVTVTRSDLAPQTIAVNLDNRGQITPDSVGGSVLPSSIAIRMQSSTAVLAGVVAQRPGEGEAAEPVGEFTVSLTSGTSSYAMTTASLPSDRVGEYRIENLPPGTYTVSVSFSGVTPATKIVQLTAGVTETYSPTLKPSAQVAGVVRTADGVAVGSGWVVELYRSSEYPTEVYRRVVTDAEGAFDFGPVDAPEVYVAQARRTRGSAPAGSRTFRLRTSEQRTALTVTVDD